MTPEQEEFMRRQVRAMLSQGQPSGMAPSGYTQPQLPSEQAYMDAYKDLSARESRIAAERAYADKLRGSEAPQGRTVGPYNVYVGPNWGEALAHVGSQAMGGYLTAKANQKDEALDAERDAITANRARLQRALDQVDLAKWGAGHELDVRGADLAESTQDWRESVDLRDFGYEREQDKIANAFRRQEIAQAAANEAGRAARSGQEHVYIDEDGNIDWKNTKSLWKTPQGLADKDGPVDESRWMLRDDPNLTAASAEGVPGDPYARNPSSSEKDTWRTTKSLIGGQYDSIEEQRQKLTPADIEQLNSTLTNAAIQGLVPKDFREYAREQAYSPAVMDYMEELYFWESEVSRMMSGKQVTGFEMENRNQWSPGAPGITAERRKKRMDFIREKFGNDIKHFEETYPGWVKNNIGKQVNVGGGTGGVPESAKALGITLKQWNLLSADEQAEFE